MKQLAERVHRRVCSWLVQPVPGLAAAEDKERARDFLQGTSWLRGPSPVRRPWRETLFRGPLSPPLEARGTKAPDVRTLRTSETGRQLSAQTVIATAAQPCGKGDLLPLPLRIDTETNSVLRVRKQRGGLSGLEETTLDEDRTRCLGRAAVVALNLQRLCPHSESGGCAGKLHCWLADSQPGPQPAAVKKMTQKRLHLSLADRCPRLRETPQCTDQP